MSGHGLGGAQDRPRRQKSLHLGHVNFNHLGALMLQRPDTRQHSLGKLGIDVMRHVLFIDSDSNASHSLIDSFRHIRVPDSGATWDHLGPRRLSPAA